jgi:hypothetical protein
VDPRPCYVLEDGQRYPGHVLAWYQEAGDWRAVVRYAKPGAEGHVLNYERAMPAAVVERRDRDDAR